MYSGGGIYTTHPNRWWAYSGLVPKHRELPMSRASWSLPPPPFTDMLHYNSAPQARPLQEFGSNFEECCKSGKKCWSDTKSRDISFQKEIWSYSTSYQEEGKKQFFDTRLNLADSGIVVWEIAFFLVVLHVSLKWCPYTLFPQEKMNQQRFSKSIKLINRLVDYLHNELLREN